MTEPQNFPGGDPHVPRLTEALQALLNSVRVAALGTLQTDGSPFVSMVPFAMSSEVGTLVIHVSSLAPHTANMERHPAVSVLVMQPEEAQAPVHALPRVSLDAQASILLVGSVPWTLARQAYLQRFPEAEPMTALGDFRFVALRVSGARQVAGFGAARTLDASDLPALWSRMRRL